MLAAKDGELRELRQLVAIPEGDGGKLRETAGPAADASAAAQDALRDDLAVSAGVSAPEPAPTPAAEKRSGFMGWLYKVFVNPWGE